MVRIIGAQASISVMPDSLVEVTARLLEENVTERITADLARVAEDNLRITRAAGDVR